jgi:DnaJ homolog subfamily A member 5
VFLSVLPSQEHNMGQSQSSNQDSDDQPPAKTDYYDLLGVERTATDDELKKAYRRKALELHPDRNYGNVEETTRLFAEVQTAYEVLSDPQERAWYDSHKDVLLRGEQPGADGEAYSYNIRMTTAIEVQQLMLKFNGRLDFSDSPSGFFGGLHEFFQQLSKEEDIACQWENVEPVDYPVFGHKDDNYEDVVRPFYAAWTGFATRKSYSWKDQYKLSDAPDRRIRRLMEKENKKIREDGIQEYNDAVRSLIAFVRKRDPRVQNNQKSEAERQKALREAAAAQAARSRAERDAQMRNALSDLSAVPDWAQSRAKDEHEGGFSSESEAEDHEYECVVCDKIFKSEAQLQVHERSKKHLKLLKQLQREMREENADILDKALGSTEASVDDSHDEQETQPTPTSDAKAATSDSASDSDGGHEVNPSLSNDSAAVDRPSDDDASSCSDDDYASRETIERRLADGSPSGLSEQTKHFSLGDESAKPGTETPKLGKAKQKRAKKAAQEASGNVSGVSTPTVSEFRCMRCGMDAASKTQLFKHLKDNPSHAAPLTQTKGKKAGKGKRK